VQAQQLAAGMWGEFVKLQEAIKGGRKPEHDYAKALDIARQLGLSAAGGIEAPVTADADVKPVLRLRDHMLTARLRYERKITFTSDPVRSAVGGGRTGAEARKPRLQVFIACMSSQHGSASAQRDLIRNTWMTSLNQNKGQGPRHGLVSGWGSAKAPVKVGMRFFLGGPQAGMSADLQEEIAKHGDIVVLDAPDNYDELRVKVLTAMQWVHKHVNTSFLLKVDDDCYVNVNVLVKEAAKLPRRRAYYGSIDTRKVIKKNRRIKWSENNLPADFPDTFPPYALGPAYVLSGDLVEYLAFPSVAPLPLLNEDAYIGQCRAPGLRPFDLHVHAHAHMWCDGGLASPWQCACTIAWTRVPWARASFVVAKRMITG